jgi:hypothetical protein
LSRLAELQDRFQQAILGSSAAVLPDLRDGPRTDRGDRFDIYRNAYRTRLIDTLAQTYTSLHAYLGDETFFAIGEAYVAATPSGFRNLRWYGDRLADFLAQAAPNAAHPVLSELAALEWALGEAFDAADSSRLTLSDLATIDPSRWADLVFRADPTVRRLSCGTNVFAIWTALRDGLDAPAVQRLPLPEPLLIWRDETPMVRSLAAEEALDLDEALRGLPFGQLCVLLATLSDPETAAARAAGYLGLWVRDGLLASFQDAT